MQARNDLLGPLTGWPWPWTKTLGKRTFSWVKTWLAPACDLGAIPRSRAPSILEKTCARARATDGFSATFSTTAPPPPPFLW